MQLVKRMEQTEEGQTHRPLPGGLAGWLLAALARLSAFDWKRRGSAKQPKLQLMETLPLGGRRQLMLVNCAGKQFLIGAGPDSISSMIRISAEDRPGADLAAKKLAEPWA